MSLNIDRSDIAENAAVLVCLANLDNLDIYRQPFDFRDRLAHCDFRFLFEFIGENITEIWIFENPPGGFDVVNGIAFVNQFGWILSILGRSRLPRFWSRVEREGCQWKSMRSGAGAPATRCVSISIDGPGATKSYRPRTGTEGQGPQAPVRTSPSWQ